MVGECGKEEGDGGRGGREEEGGRMRRLIHPHGYKVTCTNVHTYSTLYTIAIHASITLQIEVNGGVRGG